MANIPGPQPDVKFCPSCKAEIRNVPRSQMRSPGYKRSSGIVSPHTHTYHCPECHKRFEINQAQYRPSPPAYDHNTRRQAVVEYVTIITKLCTSQAAHKSYLGPLTTACRRVLWS